MNGRLAKSSSLWMEGTPDIGQGTCVRSRNRNVFGMNAYVCFASSWLALLARPSLPTTICITITHVACLSLVLGALPLLLRHELVLDGLDRRQVARLWVDACMEYVGVSAHRRSGASIHPHSHIGNVHDGHTYPRSRINQTPLSAWFIHLHTQHMRTL